MKFETRHKKEEIYATYLREIGGIKFTAREVDIIACIINNRGNKKIASLLSISHRTVETHIRSMVQKIGYGSRDQLIDLANKSGKLVLITQYYLALLIQDLFNRQFQKVGKIINKQAHTYLIYCLGINTEEEKLLKQLVEYLKVANVNLNIATELSNGGETVKNNLYILSDKLLKTISLDEGIFILFDKNLDCSLIKDIEYIDLCQEKDYYISLFKLLKKIVAKPEIEEVIKEFNIEYQSIINFREHKSLTDNSLTTSSLSLIKKALNKKFIFLLSCLVCLSIFTSGIIPNKTTAQKVIRSSFIIPHKSVLLERTSIIAKIKEKLNNKDDIKTVVLVGTGGAGKTTLARLYASKEGATVIWEINAETKDSITDSFEDLGYALAKTKEQKLELKAILEIQDLNKKQTQLVYFIRNQLKTYTNWVLIFDNVESFADIKNYFPYEGETWGKGKIILTTRNSTIANNSYIGANQVVFLENLNPVEQLQLFTKILNAEDMHNYSKVEQDKIKSFLQNIPPYPLDVSTAAYYIKEIGITYEEYLNRKEQCSQGFVINQEDIIKEKSNYIKNRYAIVTLSLKHLIEKSPDFASLLLLISMVDSQNIPRSLLDAYKDKIIIDNFLNKISTYSIIYKNDLKNNDNFTLSLHRSTQAIILSYLTTTLELKNDSQLIEFIATTLEQYIHLVLETEDLVLIRQMLPHITSFVEKSVVNERIKAYLRSKIGHIYWAVYLDNAKAAHILQQALSVQEQYYKEPNPHTAYTLGELGIAYRLLGNDEKSQHYIERSIELYKRYYKNEDCIEIARLLVTSTGFHKRSDYQKTVDDYYKGLSVYKKYYGEDHIKTAWIYSGLGAFYRMWGKYNKSKDFLEKTIAIHENTEIKNKIEYAWLIINLGVIYQNIGDLMKAKELIEEGLSIYKKNLKENNIEIAWGQIHLAITYGHLGNWQKAKHIIEEYLPYYTQYYDHSHENIAWILEKLGIVYRELKDFSSAYEKFSQSRNIYKKRYGDNSIQVALSLYNIGKTKFLEADLNTAEEYLNKALEILENSHQDKAYRVLETLIELYKQQAANAKNYRDNTKSQVYYSKKTQECVNKLLIILENNFPENSPYVNKIKQKLGI